MILLLAWPAPASASQDATRARALEAQLMAPCCWSQTVDVHHSPAADAMRAEIRTLIDAGRTDGEIRARFVEEYGTRILVVPPAEGVGAALYVTPALVLIVSAGALGLLVRRFTRAGRTADPAAPLPDASLATRLDDELSAMD